MLLTDKALKAISQDELAASLDTVLTIAAQLESPVLIERGGDEHDVVILSDREFRGLLTTIDLLSNPTMAVELRESLSEYRRVYGPDAQDVK